MEIGEFRVSVREPLVLMNLISSLKWHYEVFRWFDKFIGPDHE